MPKTPTLKTFLAAICMISAIVALIVMPGCSKEDDKPDITPPTGDGAPDTAPPEAALSSTLEMLGWTPDGAQVACVIPPLSDIEAKILALDERLPSVPIREPYQQFLLELGMELELGAITSIEDLGKAEGLDCTQPAALYYDISDVLENFAPLIAQLQAAPNEPPAAMMNYFMDPENYKFVLVYSVSDQEKVQKWIDSLLQDPQAPFKEQGVLEFEGNTIQTLDSFGYCFVNGKIFAGNLELLKGTLSRIKNPLELRYGTPSFPQISPDEGVMLTFGGRLLPSLEKFMKAMAAVGGTESMLDLQLEQIKAMQPMEGTDEPTVTTFIWNDEKIELRSRLDLNYYPNALEASGKPGMLRLAPMLSENTLAFVSIRFTEQMKTAMLQQMQASMQASGQDNAQTQQVDMIAKQVAEILGDELTLGFSAGGEGMPNACIMLALKNPDVVKTMVQMLAASFLEVTESYKEIDISTVKAPIPVQIAVAFPKDIALISTNVSDMKSIIDRYLAEQPSGFFGTLDPPLDSAQEHYGVFSLDGKLITDIVLPLAAMSGQMDPEGMAVAQEFASLIDSVRMASGVDEQWMQSEMTVHFQAAQ